MIRRSDGRRIRPRSVLVGAAVALAAGLGAGALVAPSDRNLRAQPQDQPRLFGFADASVADELAFEAALLSEIQPDSIARWARALGAAPHVAGTPAQSTTRDSVLRWLADAGLDVHSDTFLIYLPHPLHVEVERTSPSPLTLALSEPPIPGATPHAHDPFPVFNAYSGNGVAEGEVVYANYGLPDDYRVLDSLGVSVEGRIVIARYGRSFRGIKAREAEARGAAGLLLFSDPEDDGYRVGEVYPDGPMRPSGAVQRGSILNGAGDPSTPGWASLPDARRVSDSEMTGVARIPVVPLAYGAAAELLEFLTGPSAPPGWQGALPFHYHVGPGPASARLNVRTETGPAAFHPVHNTIAILPGAELPDEWVILGAHYDAWGPGARDNVSGTASVLAAATAFARVANEGRRPRRTLVFATWDAEEWGLIGSTEWVEAHAEQLSRAAVAYLNQDAAAGGRDFSAAASPELKHLIRSAAAAVPDPGREGSVADGWRQRLRAQSAVSESTPLRVGDLGGGSDFAPFYQSLGIPAATFGFGGPWGVYHSAYDNTDWMERFGDPGYHYHAAAASVLAVTAARLANAELLPYDFAGLGGELERVTGDLLAGIGRSGSGELNDRASAELREVRADVDRLHAEAIELDVAIVAALEGTLPAAKAQRVNELLRSAATSFVTEVGLPGLPRTRQLLFATDPDNGYATLPLPSLRIPLRAADLEELSDRLMELRTQMAEVTDLLAAARGALAD